MAKMTIKQARELAKQKDTTIRGNGAPIPFVYWYELTPKEQKEFTYLDTDDKRDDALFFRYRGCMYDFSDFMWVGNGASDYMAAFDGFMSDSFFSGIGIVLDNDNTDFIRAYTVIS